MHKIFAWTLWFGDEIARRVVYTVAFIALVSGAMIWIASYITLIAQYGWAAIVLVGVGFACVITLAISCAAMAWRYFRPLPKQAKTQVRRILKEKFIYPGTSLGCFVPPSFHATFGADNENLRLSIDEMHYVPGLGQILQTAKRRLLLREIQKVSRDETISIQMLSQSDNNGQKLWQWGTGGSPEGGYLFIPGATYQGRITVVNASGKSEHCYFVIPGAESDSSKAIPLAIGEHMFDFRDQWEAEDAQNLETSF